MHKVKTNLVHSFHPIVLDISVPPLLEPGTPTATLSPLRNWGAQAIQMLMLGWLQRKPECLADNTHILQPLQQPPNNK